MDDLRAGESHIMTNVGKPEPTNHKTAADSSSQDHFTAGNMDRQLPN